MLDNRGNKKLGLPLLMQSMHWGNDLEELRSSIHANIIGVELKVLDQQAKLLDGYLAHTEVDDLQVSFIRYGAGVRVQCQQDDVYCFVIPYGGDCCIKQNKINISNEGRLKLLPPVAELDMTYSGDCGHLVLRFKKTPFHESVFEPLFSSSNHANSREVTDPLYHVCAHFLQDCEYAEHHEKIERVVNTLKQNIYDVLLNRPMQVSAGTPLKINSINLAINFIKENPGWEYSIDDLTGLLQLSPRTLYYQFKKQTGTSPYRYYQNMKLFRARLDILKYGSLISITDIASHNGFTHLGRFASQYRHVFGELPTQTISRANGGANL